MRKRDKSKINKQYVLGVSAYPLSMFSEN